MASFSQIFRKPHLILFHLLSIYLWLSSTQSQEILSTDPSYYYNLCSPSTCGNLSLSYPFNLPTPCHYPTLLPVCSNNESLLLTIPPSNDFQRVISTSFTDPDTISFYIAPNALFTCGAKVSGPNISTTLFTISHDYTTGTHYNCSTPIPPTTIPGLQNASCVGCEGEDEGRFCYYVPENRLFDSGPDCVRLGVFTRRGFFKASSVRDLRGFLRSGYEIKYNKPIECRGCEASGGRCGANPTSGSFVCFCPASVRRKNCTHGLIEDLSTWVKAPGKRGSRLSTAVVAAISLSAVALIIGSIVALVAIFIRRKTRIFYFHKDTFSEISLRRYSYSQLQKFTCNFSSKLGEGGFGRVYKGIINQNGLEVAVAVKILKNSRHNKKHFVNEVTTIGSIHHNNLVTMLGYCVEGNTYALVYEFMENGSLDKYIYNIKNESYGFQHGSNVNYKFLSIKQVYTIALEIARGILYLHKGCNNKIMHRDIKPQNVLLDSYFSAKISDFGLARMIDKDRSHFSLTIAQGTPGYAAPEIWLKSYGPVTEKSDVYSYGMLLLEMVGRRKNYDTEASNSSQVYFPEWVYNKVERDAFPVQMRNNNDIDSFENYLGEEIIDDEDQKIIWRMCLVGLWCIQHITSNRPSMDNVIQMLEGHIDIVMPPRAFPNNTIGNNG